MLSHAMSLAPHQPGAAASLPRRFAAAAVDAAVLAVAVQAVHWSAYVWGGPNPGAWLAFEDSGSGHAWRWHTYLLVTVSLPCWVYYAWSEGSARHATPAKRWLGLRVANVYGTGISWRRALARTAVKLLPWEVAHVALCFPEPVFVTHELGMPKLLFASYALMGLYLAAMSMTLKKQSVHDLVAGTYVVRASAAPRPAG